MSEEEEGREEVHMWRKEKEENKNSPTLSGKAEEERHRTRKRINCRGNMDVYEKKMKIIKVKGGESERRDMQVKEQKR